MIVYVILIAMCLVAFMTWEIATVVQGVIKDFCKMFSEMRSVIQVSVHTIMEYAVTEPQVASGKE